MLASTPHLEQLLQSAREEQEESCEDILKSIYIFAKKILSFFFFVD